MKRLWRRIVKWLKNEEVAPDKIGYGTAHREVIMPVNVDDVAGKMCFMRDELVDMILDRQLDRARAFGRAHIARRK